MVLVTNPAQISVFCHLGSFGGRQRTQSDLVAVNAGWNLQIIDVWSKSISFHLVMYIQAQKSIWFGYRIQLKSVYSFIWGHLGVARRLNLILLL